MLVIAKTGVHARFHLKQAPEEPDEIGKAVQIRKHIGRDLSPGFDETHDRPLSAAACSTSRALCPSPATRASTASTADLGTWSSPVRSVSVT